MSELGRNMVLYAGGGEEHPRPPTAPRSRVAVIAVDQGAGHPQPFRDPGGQVQEPLRPRPRHRRTKRLADTFHIETGHGPPSASR